MLIKRRGLHIFCVQAFFCDSIELVKFKMNMNHTLITRLFPDLPSRCFAGILFLYGIVILLTFRDYGINPDEESHVTYGLSVINWYLSGFQDRRIFSGTNVWLYGGFFDTLTYLIMRVMPLDSFGTRHLCTSAMGLLGAVAAYRIGCLLDSKWTGVLAALFLILTPRYYGHVFNNHKDIPFAVLYLWSVYWQLKILRAMPQAPWSWIFVMGGITGLAMGIRVGGVMLLCFAGTFWFFKSLTGNIKRCIFQWCTAFAVAYIVMLLFWPWAQTAPLSHPWNALAEFSQFAHVNTEMLFEGQYIRITEIPWYYAPKWILLTLPEFVLMGLIAGIVVAILHWRTANKSQALSVALLITSSLAPLLYMMVSKTPLYDGVRHILFVILPLIILGALGISTLAQKEKRLRVIALCVVGVFVSFTVWEMVTLHPNQYVYFNRIFAQGVDQASKYYVTDYWNNSYKQGAKWLSTHAVAPKNRKLQIHSIPASTRLFLDPNRFETTPNPWTSDYLLVSTRYEHHRVVSGEVLHVVRARTVPLLYIIRPDPSHNKDPLFADESAYRLLHLGTLYRTNGQNENAQKAFERGLTLAPENTTLQIDLSELLLESGQHEKALEHFQKAYDQMPNNAKLIYKMGVCYEQLNNPDEAKKLYTRALKLHPYLIPAHRSLGDLLQKEKRYTEALLQYQKIIDIFPESLGDWQRIGMTRHQIDDYHGAANAWRHIVSQDPTRIESWLNLALMLYKQGKLDESLKIYDKVRGLEPDNRKALHMTGKVLLAQKRWNQTIEILKKQVQKDTLATDSWLLLAQAYRHKGEINQSQHALAKYILAHRYSSDGWLEYFELGKRYQALGDKKSAQIIYQAASKMLPDNRELQDSLQALSGKEVK